MTEISTPPECGAAREALSAALDGEEPGLTGAWLTTHLVECASCRAWYSRVVQIARRTRLSLVPEVPDLVETILATNLARDRGGNGVDRPASGRPGRRVWFARGALVVVAVAQLWVSLPQLLWGRDGDVTIHPAHELGSYGTALALGMLYAAWRPAAARGVRAIVAATAALLVTTALVDLVHGGRTTYLDEAPHLLWVAGLLALIALVRPTLPDGSPAVTPWFVPVGKPSDATVPADETAPPGTSTETGADAGAVTGRNRSSASRSHRVSA